MASGLFFYYIIMIFCFFSLLLQSLAWDLWVSICFFVVSVYHGLFGAGYGTIVEIEREG